MKIKRIICALAAILLLICASSCGISDKYVSKYKAVAFIYTVSKDPAFMSFYSFEGTKVFKLKCSEEGEISYKGILETGNLTVYYDAGEGKTELFRLTDGESVDSKGGYAGTGTVYIIVETDGKCMTGNLEFSLQH